MGRGRREAGRRGRRDAGTRDRGCREVRDVKTYTRWRKIRDVDCIAQKPEKVTITRSKKLISSQRNGANIGYFPINPHKPANQGKYPPLIVISETKSGSWPNLHPLGKSFVGLNVMSFQCLHVRFGFSHRLKGKSLLRFCGQHNDKQNKETGD